MKLGSILQKGVVLWVSQSYKDTHNALDFGLPTITERTPLYAVENGIGQYRSGYPAGFFLKGDSGALYLYQHCMTTVPINSRVARGSNIGYVDTVAHQKSLGANLSGSHCHFQLFPTGDINVSDNPLCYFDRNEVKYNKQPACTSTPLNYVGIPDKQLPDPQSSVNYELEARMAGTSKNLYMTKITGDYGGYCVVTRGGKSTSLLIDTKNGRQDRLLITGMDPLEYKVEWGGVVKTYNNLPINNEPMFEKKYNDLLVEFNNFKTQVASDSATMQSKIDEQGKMINELTSKIDTLETTSSSKDTTITELEQKNHDQMILIETEADELVKRKEEIENCHKEMEKLAGELIECQNEDNLSPFQKLILWIKRILKK